MASQGTLLRLRVVYLNIWAEQYGDIIFWISPKPPAIRFVVDRNSSPKRPQDIRQRKARYVA